MFHTQHCCAGFIMCANGILLIRNRPCIPRFKKRNRNTGRHPWLIIAALSLLNVRTETGLEMHFFYFPTKSNFMNKWFSCSEFHGLAIFSAKLIL